MGKGKRKIRSKDAVRRGEEGKRGTMILTPDVTGSSWGLRVKGELYP